jgi:hypothetical protein
LTETWENWAIHTDPLIQINVAKFSGYLAKIELALGILSRRAASAVPVLGIAATACFLLRAAASCALGDSMRAASRFLLITTLDVLSSLSAIWQSVDVDVEIGVCVLDEDIYGSCQRYRHVLEGTTPG